MKFHPDVLAAHAQFGGDLEDMQRKYAVPAPAPSATIALIKAHCDAHERSGRAQFSVAGIRLLLDHIASLEAALSPFAKEAAHFDGIPGVVTTHDNVELWQRGNYRCPTTVGDLRAARALSGNAPKSEDKP